MENLESIQSIQSIVLVIHLILALAIIGLVLIQRSEGGGLGIGGGGGGLGNFATARGTASMLTRLTAIFACGFFITSLALGILAAKQSSAGRGILETVDPAALEKAEQEKPPATGITFEPPTSSEFVPPETPAQTEPETDADSKAERNTESGESSEPQAEMDPSPLNNRNEEPDSGQESSSEDTTSETGTQKH